MTVMSYRSKCSMWTKSVSLSRPWVRNRISGCSLIGNYGGGDWTASGTYAVEESWFVVKCPNNFEWKAMSRILESVLTGAIDLLAIKKVYESTNRRGSKWKDAGEVRGLQNDRWYWLNYQLFEGLRSERDIG